MKNHEFKIIRSCGLLLLLATSWAQGNQRTRTTLTENWYIKQIETDKPDVTALTRSVASPDQTWLSAQMPAQVHEILLRHGKISDPHIGKNAADSAWVGEKDWAYACVFKSPPDSIGPAYLRFEGLDISPIIVDSSSTAGELFAQQLLQSDLSIILANHISLSVLKSFLKSLRGIGIQIIDGMNGSVRSVVRQFKEMCMADTVVIPSKDILD